MIIGAFLEVLSVGLMIPLVAVFMTPNVMVTNKMISKICTLLNISSNKSFILLCFLSLIVTFIGKNLFLLFEYNYQYKFTFESKFKTRSLLLKTYLSRPYEFFLHIESGEIIRIINSDVGNSYSLLTSILSIATELIVSSTLIIAIFVLNPLITLITAVTLGLTLLVIIKLLRPRLHKMGIDMMDAAKNANKWMLQSVNGIKEVKIQQSENHFLKKYDECGKILIETERRNNVYGNLPRLLIETVCMCTILSVVLGMVLAGYDVGSLATMLSAFAMAAVRIMPSTNRIATGINQIAFLEPALDALLLNIDYVDQVDCKTSCMALKPLVFTNRIEIKDLSYKYPETENDVIHRANMVIEKGASVGVIGPSGAGKTTVVDIILGLLKPYEGQVLCDGVNIFENYDEWLSYVGYIPQMIFMLDDTIRANVVFGNEEKYENDDAVWRALAKAQLEDFVRRLPKGLDTQIGERGVRISGGQRQRIGIARALYGNPEILIFDEATSALDNETEAAIMESIESLRNEKTMIIIAHRLSTIRNCNCVYEVANGTINKVNGDF
ncbi:MAG: ABC transporter ATP-binding protein/permease [Acetatifactor sp.]|nr:ABC transporter ATP-binding protein/permease [Acetatifactor sp.]